ncbi:MAG: hypothetical protein M0Z68_08290 [Gammaproteobacteria bacterium]|jgi:translation initiation factor 6 (eIF-6)|nr:hypothetical protein [Gammaproteobacteria bacterium]
MNGKAFEVARVDVTESRYVGRFVALNGKTVRVPVIRRTTEVTMREVAP